MTAPDSSERFSAGEGEPLLLLHGFTATWRTWGRVPADLARDFSVLAPTLPGHVGGPRCEGRPTVAAFADHAEAILDQQGWQAAHLAGFSLGGWLVLELAKRGRAHSVVPIAPGGAHRAAGAEEKRRIERLFRRGYRGARAARRSLGVLTRSPRFRRLAMRDMMVDGSRLSPRQAAAMIDCHASTTVFDDLLEELGDAEALEGLERVDAPVHLVWGEHDRVLPREHAEHFLERLPEATYEVIPAAGHVPFWDQPRIVARAIRYGASRAAA